MRDSHRPNLLDDTVDRAAIRADGAFATGRGELSGVGSDGESVEIGSAEHGEEATVVGRVEEDSRARLGREGQGGSQKGRRNEKAAPEHTLQMHCKMPKQCLK